MSTNVPKLNKVLALSALTALSPTSASAAGPSFDCAKAASDIEKLICQDSELAELDNSLAELYSVLLKNNPEQRTETA